VRQFLDDGDTVSSLVIPRVNMNGNTKEDLIEQLQAAHEALGKAIDALQVCEFSNGRNFQTLLNGGEVAMQSRTQHGEWLRALQDIKTNTMELAYELSNQ
jgi:hypothetical protein